MDSQVSAFIPELDHLSIDVTSVFGPPMFDMVDHYFENSSFFSSEQISSRRESEAGRYIRIAHTQASASLRSSSSLWRSSRSSLFIGPLSRGARDRVSAVISDFPGIRLIVKSNLNSRMRNL